VINFFILRENVKIVVKSGINHRIADQKRIKMVVRIAEITTIFRHTYNGAHCTYCCCPSHIKSNCYKLKKSNPYSGTSNNEGQGHRIFNSNDVAFTTIVMKNNFAMTCGFLIQEPVVITANPWKG
jgi:hypothetical protein